MKMLGDTWPPAPATLRLQLVRIMEEVEKLLHWLSNVLDNRVFVALTRGLWDLTSKDVLDYTEDLREGGGGQKARHRPRSPGSLAWGRALNAWGAVLEWPGQPTTMSGTDV